MKRCSTGKWHHAGEALAKGGQERRGLGKIENYKPAALCLGGDAR